jgi:hypothetical protein
VDKGHNERPCGPTLTAPAWRLYPACDNSSENHG